MDSASNEDNKKSDNQDKNPVAKKDEEVPESKVDEKLTAILSIVERQQKKQEKMDDRLRKIEKVPRERPEGFESSNEEDENVPKEASRIFRGVLGNRIALKAIEIPNSPGIRLVATVPERFHTKKQYGDFHLQRTKEVIKDGKVVERKVENYTKIDIRSKGISASFGSNMLKEVEDWSTLIRDNILAAFAKAKEPEPNFFD